MQDMGERDGEYEQSATDALAARTFRDSHLCQLELARLHRDKRATADHFTIKLRYAYLSAFRQNLALRIVEDFVIAGLKGKVAADPGLVQFLEWLLIAGLKPAQHRPAG
jgi:hypothetical protein